VEAAPVIPIGFRTIGFRGHFCIRTALDDTLLSVFTASRRDASLRILSSCWQSPALTAPPLPSPRDSA